MRGLHDHCVISLETRRRRCIVGTDDSAPEPVPPSTGGPNAMESRYMQ
jgi:hypothetical protein